MNKDTFIVYDEWLEHCEDLTDEEFGQLMRGLFKYKQTGEEPLFVDRALRACWKPIKSTFDRTSGAYADKCETNRENGKKGGRPKKPENPKNRSVNLVNFENPPEPEPEPIPEPYIAEAYSKFREEPQQRPLDELQDNQIGGIVYEWNCSSVTKNVNGIHHMTARENNTRICLGRCGFQKMLDLIRSLEHQAWFRKRKAANDPVTYDWFIKPDNFQKVLEGNYVEERKKPPEPEKEKPKNKFNDFDQRTYDDDIYEALERKMMGE